MKKAYQFVIWFFVVTGFLAGQAYADDLTISNYTLISKQRVSRTEYNYTYKADISNYGADAKNVTAALSSNSTHTIIVDGSLTFGDVDGGTTVTSSDTFTIRQNRIYPFDPSALEWDIQVQPLTQITLDQGLTTMTIEQGMSQHVAFFVTLVGTGGETYHVTFQQTVTPDNGGIVLDNDYPGGWSTSTDKAWPVNEVVTAVQPGTYTVTTTATILETGESAATELTVVVQEFQAQGQLFLNLPGFEPDGVNIGIPTDVIFTCLGTGTNNPPNELSLEEVDDSGVVIAVLGDLKDDGTNGDTIAGDFIYTGAFTITGTVEGVKLYRATALHNGSLITSDAYPLSVTRFSIGTTLSNPASLVQDTVSGELLYSDELVVIFSEGTSPQRIEEIVDAEGATIVGTIQSLGVFQLNIPGDGTPEAVWAAVAAFEGYPEVNYAGPSFHTTASAFPDDPRLSSQNNMKIIRADEAWLVAKGKVSIAVVDTGVDYNHSDLKNKVIKGKNFVGNNDDPMDAGSHGTHVAGIAAAETNNNLGVAGVAWDSKIWAVRGIGGSYPNLADAIRYAADKAKIINVSGGGYEDSEDVRKAVKYAVNTKKRLLVATPANDGLNKRFYPGAYDEAFCVGNTNDTDGRSSLTNHGTWIDISAPGDNVLSTEPNNNYGIKSGTSMSAPLVSGAAAVVWSMHPSWTAAKVRERLEKTAKPLPSSLQIGIGRLDLFEAVFNGSFETGDLSEWSAVGTCTTTDKLGIDADPILPTHGKRMGYCSTGPAGDQVAAALEKNFTIQPGVTSLPFRFWYDFITEEWWEWVGTIYDDSLRITITAPDGTETVLAEESVNSSTFFGIEGIDFPGGDDTVGHTRWKLVTRTIPVTQGAGKYTLKIRDAGDDIYDSVVVIDHIQLK